MSSVPADVLEALEREIGLIADDSTAQPVAGGSINRTLRLHRAAGPVFLKLASSSGRDMLVAEAAGLTALGATRTIRVPGVLAVGATASTAYLALEWLDLCNPRGAAGGPLGERLALLHAHTDRQFGWHRDNTIGTTLQPNPRHENWLTFWREARLGHQIELAQGRGLPAALGTRLLRLADGLDRWLGAHEPQPSLVHGDLWGGNWGVLRNGEPCVFDPAVYYGDREVDIAMTQLFGGFDAAFYAAYERVSPLPPGADARRALYNLYHLLNHFNLFGPGYLSSIATTLDTLNP